MLIRGNMLKKYLPVLNNMFEYIRNRTSVGTDISIICDEVMSKYSPEILFPENSSEGLRDTIMVLCKYAYFLHNNTTYDRP